LEYLRIEFHDRPDGDRVRLPVKDARPDPILSWERV
jgi:hypothetical protein